ncbi:enolase C-terminal domain-like protein [Streptomyces sp. NPDC057496]|uniref:enolase C-terminal domain-like protein n=1 Tax=Streptomyces sp. NPDC057496 TaxID=3346149 RepID=UPI0036B36A0A
MKASERTTITATVTVTPHVLERHFRVSHATTSTVDLLRLDLRDADGRVGGSGEISADRGFGQDGPAIAEEARGLVHALAAQDGLDRVATLEPLLDRAAEKVSGPARMLTEMALLDRAARLAGAPVWRLLDLPDPGRVELMHTVAIGDALDVAARPLKVKLGADTDADVLKELIGRPGPILLDVNEGWDRSAWLGVRNLVARLEPAVLEDPTADEELLAEIRAELPGTRVVLDESVHTPQAAERAAGLADGVNIKVMRMGGLLPALRVLRSARARGQVCMVGSFLEPRRSVAYAAQLNSLADWTDLDGHFWISGDRPVLHYRLDSSRPGIPEIAYEPTAEDGEPGER